MLLWLGARGRDRIRRRLPVPRHQQRMTRAKVLLETTYLSIEQVAQACGYTDTGSFRRVFQKITGGLPALYREQYRLRTSRRRWRQGAVTN